MRFPFLRALLLAACVAASSAPAHALAQDPYVGLRTGGWKLLGPFANPEGNSPAGGSPLDRDLDDMDPGRRWDALDEVFEHRDGKERGWRDAPSEPWPADAPARGPLDSGRINLQTACAGMGGTDNAAAFLYLAVESPDARQVLVHFGSDDGVRLWLNSELLIDRAVGRGVNPRDETAVLRLEPGVNHLLAKVANGGGAMGFEMVQPRPVSQLAIDAAIDRGVELLLSRQHIDGSWQNYAGNYPHGQTALSVYTLLKCGVATEHPAILKALAYLRGAPTEKTYSVGCLLMALEAAGRPQDFPWIEELVGDLLSWQDGAGGWAYPTGTPDMSVTQYAVLGLRAAAVAGVEIPEKVWEKALRFTLACQQQPVDTPDGPEAAFQYHADRPWTASMTTAGLSNLAIIREQIGQTLPPRERKELNRAAEMGITWMGRRFQTTNVGANAWHRYYLYGLERAGALLPTRNFGAHDWYQEGAAALVDSQKDDGSWQESHHDGSQWISMRDTDTCFALLFLKRATGIAVTQGDGGGRGKWLFKSDPKIEPVELHVINRATAVLSVRSIADPDAGSAVLARFLARRAGDDAWTLVKETRDKPFATQHAFPLPGHWEARAEVELADGAVLESTVVAFEVQIGITPEQLTYATDRHRDLLPGRNPEITASSTAQGRTPAQLFDGRAWTGWACAKDDASPELEVELRGRTRVDRFLFTHLENRNGQGAYPRPARLELWVDKAKEPILVDVHPDPRVKTVVEFPRTERVRRFRVRIVALYDGTLGAANVGFAAIEAIGERR
jgi:hypothetical protein